MRLKDWIVLGCGLLLLPILVFAETPSFVISVSPNPANTDEGVTATALGINAQGVNFIWSINGTVRPELSGVGKASVFFAAPSTPGILRVSARAVPPTGASTTVESVVPLQLSEVTKAFQKITSQADQLLLQQQEVEEQLVIDLSLQPETPEPGSTVTLTVHSFQANLVDASIAWFSNGKEIARGQGLTSTNAALDGAGSRTDVRVSVTLPDGRHADAARSITPSSLSFYWWSDSYVPSWYQGKALPAPGSVIYIQVRPSFPTTVSQSLIYTWSLNNEVIPQISGRGRSIFAYTIPSNASSLDPISVRVTNSQRSISQEAGFTVPIASPEPLLYEMKPLAGIDTAHALTSLTRSSGTPVDISVEPFFVPRPLLSKVQYQWNLNGTDLSNEKAKQPRLLTVTSSAGTIGTQAIRITLNEPSGTLSQSQSDMELRLQ